MRKGESCAGPSDFFTRFVRVGPKSMRRNMKSKFRSIVRKIDVMGTIRRRGVRRRSIPAISKPILKASCVRRSLMRARVTRSLYNGEQ
jgi:hypothetical protein